MCARFNKNDFNSSSVSGIHRHGGTVVAEAADMSVNNVTRKVTVYLGGTPNSFLGGSVGAPRAP